MNPSCNLWHPLVCYKYKSKFGCTYGENVNSDMLSHALGASHTRSSDDSKNFNAEDKTNHDRMEKPVVCRDANHAQGRPIEVSRPHGHRHGKTPEKKEYHLVHNLKKRCIKKNFKGIHDRFLRDPEFRTAMLEYDRDEEVCIK